MIIKSVFSKLNPRSVIPIIVILCISLSILSIALQENEEHGMIAYAQQEVLTFCIPSPGKLLELNPYFYIASPPLTHGMFLKLIYETLAEEKPDGSLEPLLAVSWNISQNGKVITLKLRQGVFWHDGVPFTSRDVAFVLETIKRFPQGDVYSLGKYTESVETPDNTTVIIKLSQPFSRYLYYLLTGYRIFPEHVFKDKNMAEFQAREPQYVIGTGPYKLIDANYDTQVFRLVAFDKYWGGVPKIREVIVQIVDETAPIPLMLKGGQCSIAAITNPAYIPPIVSDPNFRIATAKGWPYQGTYYTPAGLLVINTAEYPLNITEFRRALAYAINKERIIQLALQGYGEIASSGQLPISSKWRPSDLEEITYNVTKSKEILRSLGFIEGSDGFFRYPNGSVISIKIIHTGGVASNVVALIVQDWRSIGLDVSEEMLTRLAYVNKLSYGYYQVAMLLTNRPTDVDFVLTVFMDRNLTPTPIGQPTQYWGWTRYVNPLFNEYIEKARSATTEEEAFKYYAEAQRIAARDQWVIPLYYSKAIWAFNIRDFTGWDKMFEGQGFPTHEIMLSVKPNIPQAETTQITTLPTAMRSPASQRVETTLLTISIVSIVIIALVALTLIFVKKRK